MPVMEDDRGAYIFSSRDLCMIEHVDRLIAAGIASLKIEGRMKSVNYLASTVKVYREAIDTYYDHPENYRVQRHWIEELAAIDNRGFSTGFYFGDPGSAAINYTDTRPGAEHRFIAKILHSRPSGRVVAAIKNKMCVGDAVEVLRRGGPIRSDTILEISDSSGTPLDTAMPNSTVILTLSGACGPNDLIRRLENTPAA
jgi:putative protease